MKSIVETRGHRGASGRQAQSLRDEVRHLWSRLQLTMPAVEDGRLRLAFCSTHPGEGTTSVACNMAIFLGEQGRTTSLVEANLRHPSLADHFGFTRSPGLSEYLEGTARYDEAMRRDVAPLVDVLPAGSPPEDIYGLLAGGGFRRVVEEVHEKRDMLVIDAPPLSAAPESGPIFQSVDAAILVVQAHRTRRQAVEKSIQTFSELGVAFCGIVLNRVSYDLPPIIDHIL